MPNTNVVVKVPKNLDEIYRALEETHFIEALYDHKECQSFVVDTREELILCDSKTKEIFFYCVFFQRASSEIIDSFTFDSLDSSEDSKALGQFLVYMF